MEDQPPQLSLSNDVSEMRDLAKATRFAVVCIVLGLSYFSIRASLNIPAYMRVYEDMLGSGSQLPGITVFVFKAQHLFVGISFAVPALSLGLLFVRNIPRAMRVIGVLVLEVIVQSIVLYHALLAPITEIIRRMQGGAPM
jgi:hypothetical protein